MSSALSSIYLLWEPIFQILDQTAPLGALKSGFIVFASKELVWSAFKCMQQTLKANSIFFTKNTSL